MSTKETENKVILPCEYAEDEHYYIEQLGDIPKKRVYSFFKRVFDIFLSLFGLIFLLLFFVVIGAIIKITSKGPILYKQERLGLNGKKYNLLKFRTMCADAEKGGAQWSKGDNDERITKFGRFLRRTRLDELPQFWNCLIGNMSFIGPRPEREIFYDEFEKHIHGFRERLKVKPGLTGLAQVEGGYDLKPQEKIVYDVEYIKNRSAWLDFKIFLKTFRIFFTHEGAK